MPSRKLTPLPPTRPPTRAELIPLEPEALRSRWHTYLNCLETARDVIMSMPVEQTPSGLENPLHTLIGEVEKHWERLERHRQP